MNRPRRDRRLPRLVAGLAFGLAGAGASAGHPGHAYFIDLKLGFAEPTPISLGGAMWRCDGGGRQCQAMYARDVPTVEQCRQVVRRLGWALNFGRVDGPRLTAAQLAECNRVAPNQPPKAKAPAPNT